MPWSMSSLEAKPDSYMRIADSRYGISSALTTKPARSWESMHCLPSVLLGELAHGSTVSGSVMIEVTSSTSGSTGTGLKKCMPEHAAGVLGLGAELHDRHRGGVGGEELRVGQQLVETPVGGYVQLEMSSGPTFITPMIGGASTKGAFRHLPHDRNLRRRSGRRPAAPRTARRRPPAARTAPRGPGPAARTGGCRCS